MSQEALETLDLGLTPEGIHDALALGLNLVPIGRMPIF
jgi:hypothetical protein